MDEILIYSLVIYFFFHVFSRSDLLAKPRLWAQSSLPGWTTYPLSCCFCFSFWVTIVVALAISLTSFGFVSSSGFLFVPPVINYFLDLVARSAIKYLTPS